MNNIKTLIYFIFLSIIANYCIDSKSNSNEEEYAPLTYYYQQNRIEGMKDRALSICHISDNTFKDIFTPYERERLIYLYKDSIHAHFNLENNIEIIELKNIINIRKENLDKQYESDEKDK